MSHAKFITEFVRSPGRIGALAPSSRRLARRMVEWIEWKDVNAVVEYGPGTGVFTEKIVESMHPGTRFFAIEFNRTLADALSRRIPQVRVHRDCVSNVEALCQKEGVTQLDAVVCGLPWASFPHDRQQKCLDAMLSVLKPGGQFVTFAYLQGLLLPAGQRFKHALRRHFSYVQRSRTEWLNLPPAFVYRCRR